MTINTSRNHSETPQHSALSLDLSLIPPPKSRGINGHRGISAAIEWPYSDEYLPTKQLSLSLEKVERTVKQCQKCSQKFYKHDNGNLRAHHFCISSGRLPEVASQHFARQGVLFLKSHLKGPLPKLDLRSVNPLTEHKVSEFRS